MKMGKSGEKGVKMGYYKGLSKMVKIGVFYDFFVFYLSFYNSLLKSYTPRL